MKRITYAPVILLLITVALLAAQCGANPTPSEQAETQPTPVEVAATTATDKPGQEVQESEALKAKAVKKGSTIVSDEDVSTPRTHFGGEYRKVDTADAVSFHPYLTTDVPSSEYQGLVYSYELLRLDEKTLDYVPHMAESYSISEDGLSFTFHLRRGMKWSDGQPLTAQDYKWTYDQVVKPEHEFPYLSQLEFITSYEALDDYTLQIKIGKIYAPALGQMAGLITPLPKHIWEKLDWSDPNKNPEINHPTVVSGPYKLVEWKRDQHAVFEANENYWYHGPPNIQRRTIEIVPDQDIAFQKLKGGETDAIGRLTPEQLKAARELKNVTIYEWWPAAAIWSYIGLNMRADHPTHDLNVRQGINYAIDKDLLTEQVWLGQAKRMCSIYPETSWAYTPDVPCYAYSKEKAIASFAKAGYIFKDGKMLNKEGQQLKLRLLYGPNTSQTAELIAVTVQDYLAAVGVDVDIQALEWASYLEALHAKEPQWDMQIGAWSSAIEPHIQFTNWVEKNIPELNQIAYINKKVETLFEEAGATYDVKIRKQKYAEIQKIIAAETPYIFLAYRKETSPQNNRIKGIEASPLGIDWGLANWYIQK